MILASKAKGQRFSETTLIFLHLELQINNIFESKLVTDVYSPVKHVYGAQQALLIILRFF